MENTRIYIIPAEHRSMITEKEMIHAAHVILQECIQIQLSGFNCELAFELSQGSYNTLYPSTALTSPPFPFTPKVPSQVLYS